MSNHFYKVGGEIYKQSEGGSMGMDMTYTATNIYIIGWDADFLERCDSLNLKLELFILTTKEGSKLLLENGLQTHRITPFVNYIINGLNSFMII